jgi:hypothetical protein
VFCFVCFRPVSCVPNVASFCGLSILYCPFGFLKAFIYNLKYSIVIKTAISNSITASMV